MNKPNPGSKEAITKSCKCPVLDNNFGKGIIIGGKPRFWIADDCPLHGELEGLR